MQLNREAASRFLTLRPTTSLYTADILVVLTAASLPWSTTLPAIFVGLWLFALLPIIDIDAFRQLVRRPICYLPIAFFLLALIGTLWSSAPWSARIYAVGPVAKFLVIPLLIYHFRRSSRGTWVFVAFFASCTLLMVLSWIVAIEPRLALKPDAYYGVPVKNYIDQSQAFALCTVGVLYVVVQLLRQRQHLKAGLLIAISAGFFANMTFIVVSRTAMVTMPIMLGAFAFLHLNRRGMMAVIGTVFVIVVAGWFSSPGSRERISSFASQYYDYEVSNDPTSVGLRLEFWRKSLRFFSEAPLAGHGTGSVKALFTADAAGQTGASAEIIANPHNQTLYVAVQWGLLGVAILYAMWLCHLLLFRGNGLAYWVGLLVVTQNILTSVFNSHLFDFQPGWMYVLGVGVAGGMVLSVKETAPLHDRKTEIPQ